VTDSVADGGADGGAAEITGSAPDTGVACPGGSAAPPAQARYAAVFVVVAAGIVVVNLDLFIVNVALPSIGRGFGGTNLSSLSWVLNAYAIVFAALLVPAGRAADLIGRRAAFLAGMIVFALASAACAAAPDVWVLVGARVVQAAGGALLIPASLSLLLAAAPPERRTGAIRAWTSVGGAAAALGPVVGGALVAASWHWVFLVNVPVIAIALLFGIRVLTPDRVAASAAGQRSGRPAPEAEIRPDVLGAAVFTVAICALAFALVKADDWGWASAQVLGGFALAAALIALFIYRSARHPAPVVELHLLRRPVFATATAANVVFGVAFGAMLLLVTLWCQDVWGWSALRTGLGVAPGPLLVPFWAIAAGPIARRIGPGPVAALGCAIYAGGCVFWRLNLSLAPDYPAHMLPGMLLTGTGVGLTLPTLVSAAVSAVPPNRFATGSGIVTMARQVGIVLGVALLVTVLGSHAAGPGALPAFQRATVVLAAAAASAGLVSLLLVWAVRRDRAARLSRNRGYQVTVPADSATALIPSRVARMPSRLVRLRADPAISQYRRVISRSGSSNDSVTSVPSASGRS
jgi:EmrB/QacA subfamily drug resistance transporter